MSSDVISPLSLSPSMRNILLDLPSITKRSKPSLKKTRSDESEEISTIESTSQENVDLTASTSSITTKEAVIHNITAEDGPIFLKILAESPDVVNWDNMFENENTSGYRDIQLTVTAKNKHVYELQLNTSANVQTKKTFHDFYKIARGIGKENVDRETATGIAKGLYDVMDKAYDLAYAFSKNPSGTPA